MVVIAMITGIQLRGAMGILGWSVKDVADKSKAGTTTITEMRKVDGIKDSVSYKILKRVHAALNKGLSDKGVELDDKHVFRAKGDEK